MSDLFSLIARHGYVVIAAVVFAEAIGLPVPAALVLVWGGAAAAAGSYKLAEIIALSAVVMIVGDVLLFVLGRYMGWGLLGLLCHISANPETCILRSAESFYKRGKVTLLISKFIPGVNTMAPPLAGSMKMRFEQFIRFDSVGAAIYVTAYSVLGYLFRDFLAAITRGFRVAGHVVEIVLLVALLGYIAYRIWLYRRHAIYRVVPHVQVDELAARLDSDDRNFLIVDVRSHGYYDSGAARIAGSIRLEPNNMTDELRQLPREKDIYLYCT